jgi:hypothetical protein
MKLVTNLKQVALRLGAAKRMLTLPAGHNIGLVKLLLGVDGDCDEFAALTLQQARAADFIFTTLISPHSTKALFDDFFRPFSDAANTAPRPRE